MSDQSIPVNIFISAAIADEVWKKKLNVHLNVLKRQLPMTIWQSNDTFAGQDVKLHIQNAIDRADIILLLVSPYFLANEAIHQQQLALAYRKHHAGEAFLVPIYLIPCEWTLSEFARLQGLPRSGKTITEWEEEDEALYQVSMEIKNLIEMVQLQKAV